MCIKSLLGRKSLYFCLRRPPDRSKDLTKNIQIRSKFLSCLTFSIFIYIYMYKYIHIYIFILYRDTPIAYMSVYISRVGRPVAGASWLLFMDTTPIGTGGRGPWLGYLVECLVRGWPTDALSTIRIHVCIFIHYLQHSFATHYTTFFISLWVKLVHQWTVQFIYFRHLHILTLAIDCFLLCMDKPKFIYLFIDSILFPPFSLVVYLGEGLLCPPTFNPLIYYLLYYTT